MVLNKSKGNMFKFCDFTWNVIKGCKYDCPYCYVKALSKRYGYSLTPRLDEKALRDNLGENRTIFVSATGDMFVDFVKKEWILKVLEVCNKYPKNTYLFQSKNPDRFVKFLKYFPPKLILGTTIETTEEGYSKAPSPEKRMCAMESINIISKVDKIVTIEPLIEFSLPKMVDWIKRINPKWVNIGADSKGSKLKEPRKEKIELLIKELKKFTSVKLKDNLKRLM